jgi:hypothetical protein
MIVNYYDDAWLLFFYFLFRKQNIINKHDC